MKKTVFSVMLSLFALTLFAQNSINGSITHNNLNRTYSVYIPAIYDGNEPVPLVFNLHGYGSNAQQQELYGDFRSIADTANFILVHPNGTSASGSQFWNVGFFPSNIDDVGFLEALIDSLSANYNINHGRIYSTGMSNGGFMSYLLACKSDRFAAIASVTGSMTTLNFDSCFPSKSVPVMQIHGTMDATVPYEGTAGFIHVDTVVSFWVNQNQCNPVPDIFQVPNINPQDGTTTVHYVYSGGDNGASVELYKVINGGHTWPGAIFSIGSTSMDFSASKEIWRFFSKYQNLNTTSVEENFLANNQNINIYPNPASEFLTIQIPDFTIYQLSVYSVSGNLLYNSQIKGDYLLSLNGFSPGAYIVQFASSAGTENKKLVIH